MLLTSQERLFARLAGLFGDRAGSRLRRPVRAHVVRRASRTGEVGVRMALGALPSDVLRMVLLDAAGLVALGLTLGGSAAFMGTGA